jgi:glycosyltransferase involved in cell wall biosynthesis
MIRSQRNSSGNVSISVVISTYNRASSLDLALESLATQNGPLPFEVILVDNNSTDQTQQIARKWSTDSRLLLKSIVEERQGISYARNTGIDAASGQIVAFLDDDAIAAEVWLESILDSFQSHDAQCVGGRVDPIWETPRPTWLHDRLLFAVSVVDHGNSPRELVSAYPLGCNFAVLRCTLKELGGFQPALGRIRGQLLSGEELEFFQRLQKRGGRIYYNPRMLVRHLVPSTRASKPYLRRRRYWDGRSTAIRDSLHRGLGYRVAMAGGRVFAAIPFYIMAMSLTGIHQVGLSFYYQCQALKSIGYVAQTANDGLSSLRRL